MEQRQLRQVQEEVDEYEPIKYGDLFPVKGELADKGIAPQDAAAMRSAEKSSLGETITGGAAELMQSAAKVNIQTGLVEPGEALSNQGIRVVKTDIGDDRIVVTEVAGDQVLSKHEGRKPTGNTPREGADSVRDEEESPKDKEANQVTLGEALETVALSAGDKPVTQSDAAAIHTAERRVTGSKEPVPGGISDEAWAAADRNLLNSGNAHMTTLGDVLADAKRKLPEDKPVTKKDAEAVMWAELRMNESVHVTPGGVGESVVAAARLNLEMDQE